MANRLGYTDLSHRFAPLLHEGGRAGSGSHDPRSIGTRLLYVLKREGVVISMDGRGRAFDNIFVERLWRSVKHEDVYLKGYASMGELLLGLTDYFAFYNSERPHQSLANKTPDVVYRSAIGGGAMIVDKFGGAVEGTPAPLRSTGDSSTAKASAEATTKSKTTAKSEAKPGQRRPAASAVECAA